jgi:hypothetical protein
LPLFYTIFVSFWINFSAVGAHIYLLGNCEFRATWRSEIRTVLYGLNELLLLLLLLIILDYMPVSFINVTN